LIPIDYCGIFEPDMYNLLRDKDKYFRLGRVLKTYGYKGDLVFAIDSDDPSAFSGLDMVFLDMEGSLVPWFIGRIAIEGSSGTVSIDDVGTPEKAQELVGCDIYLPIERLAPLTDRSFYFHEVIGFTAIDSNHGVIGTVAEILDRPEQEIIRIVKGDQEILVPLADEIIVEVDRKGKIIHLDTPPGLVDLYID